MLQETFSMLHLLWSKVIPATNSLLWSGIGFLALWRMLVVIQMHIESPRNIPIKFRSFTLGKCFYNFDFVLDAPYMIARAYKELESSSFAIPALNEYQVLACSELDIRAVCQADESTLSFQAAMTDRLKFKHTMFGFEFNEIDPHSAVPARTLKVLLRTHLPRLRPIIKKRILQAFNIAISHASQNVNGWSSISAFSLAKQITGRVNTQICLGTELADTPGFVETANRYGHDAVVAAEISRHLPSFLTPFITKSILMWSGASHKVHNGIEAAISERLKRDEMSKEPPMDCAQWIIQSSQTAPQKTRERLVQQTGAVFFASLHQMPMALVYAIYSLCLYPEYIDLLREEAEEKLDMEAENPFKGLALLDAFLRESARLNPLDALSVQRKVLRPFDLPSGAHIPKGNLIAVPQQAMFLNEQLYHEPDTFNAFRFMQDCGDLRRKDVTLRYSDVSCTYPYWGSPKKPCPGRWYVSETLKLSILHLVMNFEVKLADKNSPRLFFWTTALAPSMKTKILLRSRVNKF